MPQPVDSPRVVPRSLPRGRSSLPREVVLVSQRERLLEAMVEAVAAKGYAAATVGDVIRAARVSRTTFYEQFSDKEQCFIAAYEDRARLHLEHVRAAAKQAAPGVQRLQAGVRAYLEVLAAEPAYGLTALVEVPAAGPAAAGSRDLIHARYADMLRKWHAEARSQNELIPAMPEEVFGCAIGGVSDQLSTIFRQGQAERLPGLAAVVVTFLLNVGAVPAGRDLAAALSASRAQRR